MVKLNLGSGACPLDGYINIDALNGGDDGALTSVERLQYAGESVDEVRASHVLEHFPHGQVAAVLADWVRVLKPGGTIRIAVPDFGVIASQYASGESINAVGYVMGGQTDERDFHRALFDETLLRKLLQDAGLISIRRWVSETTDCASLPVSLNLAATKPPRQWPKVAAVISMPRLGFNDFWACAYQELAALKIPLAKVTGAYWDRDLTLGIERELKSEELDWILTCDYDTVFTRHQVLDLLSLAARYPHADAIAPLQTARHHNSPMFTARLPTGALVENIERSTLTAGELLKVESAHFGLTLLRASKLRALNKPWFSRLFDDEGGFGDDGCDPDVNFWRHWKAAGNSLYVALRVPVGHCELMVRWPDMNLETVFQRPSEFWAAGTPDNVWR